MIVPDPFPGWGTLGGEKMGHITDANGDVIRDMAKAFGPLAPAEAESNRFDPFEALDEILEFARTIQRECTTIGVNRLVENLRAYITGMER